MEDGPYGRLRELLGQAPDGPWRVAQRSSPGYRVETERGAAVAFGPEPPWQAPVADLLVEARAVAVPLLDERSALEAERDVLLALLEERTGERDRLRSALADVLEGLEDSSLPDWFQGRVSAALASAGVEAQA